MLQKYVIGPDGKCQLVDEPNDLACDDGRACTSNDK
jgi:hypothetical protein